MVLKDESVKEYDKLGLMQLHEIDNASDKYYAKGDGYFLKELLSNVYEGKIAQYPPMRK